MENAAQHTRPSPSLLEQLATSLDKTRLIIFAAFLALLATRTLLDPDYFWHLKAGEFIVANGALPDGDIFSHTRYGQDWVLHEWLFEVLLFSVHALGGDLAVMCMTAVFGSLAVIMIARCTLRTTGDNTATFIATALAFISFTDSISPRPQLITYCLLAYYLTSLIDFKYAKKHVSTLGVAAAMVLWVNSHGGFLIGIALLFIFTGCEWTRAWFGDAYSTAAEKGRLVGLTKTCGLALAATLVNPDFIWHWAYPIMVLGMQTNAVITEWKSPSFHGEGSEAPYLFGVALFVLAYIYAGRKRDATEIILPGFFILNGFISVRHIPLASLVALPFMAIALSDGVIARITGWWRASAFGRAVQRVPGAARELGASEYILNWILAGVLATMSITLMPAFDAKKKLALEAIYPVKAVDYVLANGISGVMYNDYDHGGYLIHRLAPQIKVMIDGRADVYGDEFISTYRDISGGRRAWKERLAALNVDFAITGIDAPIRQLMIHGAGFRQVYADERFVVLLRDRSAVKAPGN